MDTITSKILVVILSLFIIIIVLRQFAVYFDDSFVTETAMPFSSVEKVSLNSVFVRDEDVISESYRGVLSYPSLDGSKLANGSIIAYVYGNEKDIYNNYLIKKLEEEVFLLEKQQSPGTTDVAQPEFISSLIDEKYQLITSLIANKDLEKLAVERKELQSLLGIHKIIIDVESDYNAKIDSLNNEIELLKEESVPPTKEIISENSGYFVSYVDGYESIYTTDKIDEITLDQIESTIANDGYNKNGVASNSIGKMIDDYNWNIVGIVDVDKADYNVGSFIEIKLTSSPDSVLAQIIDLKPTEHKNQKIIVLECDKLNYNLVQNRTERIELVMNDFEGLKIPKEAVRFNADNEKGVYVLMGERVDFKKVEILYETDEYMISAYKTDDDYVGLYDDVIVSGKINTENIIGSSSNTQIDEIWEEETSVME